MRPDRADEDPRPQRAGPLAGPLDGRRASCQREVRPNETIRGMSVLVVSGTGTAVGKTVVTAGVAALARERGERVAVVKPGQTGAGTNEEGDLEGIRRLSRVTDLHEHARFPDPLSPAAAARRASMSPVDLSESASRVRDLVCERQLVLVEGAGGLLVRYDRRGTTIADLAAELAAPVLVVTASGLGTLNVTALTLEALAHRGLALAGLVVGAWPSAPDVADYSNLEDLEAIAGASLSGIMPDGVGQLPPEAFRAAARAGLGPALGGTFRQGTEMVVPADAR